MGTGRGPVVGEGTRTPYSGNALNRLSFLREDRQFLDRALRSQNARFLPFVKCDPLLRKNKKLEYFTLADIGSAVVGEPYSQSEEEMAAAWRSEKLTSGSRTAQVVFLGIDQRGDLKSAYSGSPEFPGAPCFAVDLTVYPHTEEGLATALQVIGKRIEADKELAFNSTYLGSDLDDQLDLNIIAEGRMLLDWIHKTRFCGGCAGRNIPSQGGFKLICTEALAGDRPCPTKNQVSSLSFPRTDCCVIAAILSYDGQRVLIAKGARFRRNMYSCIAGFLECGESIEDCVRREAFEEAGIKVGPVKMVASQPWPFPAQLMIGCIAQVADDKEESQELRLDLDNELVDAVWISREDLGRLCAGTATFGFSVPPPTSIAFTLLEMAAKME